ncbi:MAG: nucleotidyltransferase domain-containing protein [Clostridiales bacterium]|nr:nucleotidyltransferase domain-containing protein [Clostridiales bacterium]
MKYLFENLGPSIDQVWVFGSAVTPDHYSWSDLDMLLLGDISDEDLLRIYGGFSEARKLDTWNTNKNVDIVCDTLSNFERDKDEFGHVLWYVNRYGVLYYDRRWDNE